MTTSTLRVVDLRGDRTDPRARLPRAAAERVAAARDAARRILDDVRDEGDAAVRRWTRELDGWQAAGEAPLEVGLDEARRALEELPAELAEALRRAAEQVRWFHEQAKPRDWMEKRNGAVLGVRHQPLRRVGVYVPGGRAAYPSTVLMTVVPARVAGVDEVVLCTPPGRDGEVNRTILAAAALAGADRIFRVGGAQAIGAMAYGTASIPPCDKVVGPGNVYVAEAKQIVASEGVCGIDAKAGATEVAIIADDSADPRVVAADLVAQAEHDPMAGCILITPSEALAEAVEVALRTEVAGTKHAERVRQALDGQGAAVLVDDLDHAVEVANAFAAEHLEVQTQDSVAVAERVRAAGAVFVGHATPVALGDYAAGPNHTLPTAGTARFTGGLRTDDFYVPVNWVQYDEASLADLAPTVDALAAAEDLPAHARAVRIRLEGAP
ncbi:MAG TPA: histidinol dehydrogenase [Egibacteraceae bacterium]|nr:histidinol dehydrogenase [Egibacteraceae bacterium]